eukprot:ctg_1040.g546
MRVLRYGHRGRRAREAEPRRRVGCTVSINSSTEEEEEEGERGWGGSPPAGGEAIEAGAGGGRVGKRDGRQAGRGPGWRFGNRIEGRSPWTRLLDGALQAGTQRGERCGGGMSANALAHRQQTLAADIVGDDQPRVAGALFHIQRVHGEERRRIWSTAAAAAPRVGTLGWAAWSRRCRVALRPPVGRNVAAPRPPPHWPLRARYRHSPAGSRRR